MDGFTKNHQFIPIGKSSSKLNSDQVNLKSPRSSTLNEIKRKHTDSQNRFHHTNDRLGKKEKIPLEEIKIFNKKNKTFLLKGTSPADHKTITKIVKN